jgi:hypothetical protein
MNTPLRGMDMANPTFRSAYTVFKTHDSALLGESSCGYLPISERLVCCIWYTQAYLKALRTASGVAVRVISPGIWNLQSGPDFLRAALEFDGKEVVKGDIEIHTRSSDWSGHRHERQPAYADVIAHVSMWRDTEDEFVSTFSGKRVPQIELSGYLTRPLRGIVGQIEMEDFPYNKKAGLGKCAELLATLGKGEVRTLLSIAGEWRILEKAARYADWLRGSSYEEVLYRALLEALGYPSNKESFVLLGERLPFAVLRRVESGRASPTSPYRIQSVLMHVSGLFPREPKREWDEETKAFFRFMEGTWQDYEEGRPVIPIEGERWNRGGRPVNAPLRRMAAASLWVHRHRNQSVFSRMVRIIRDLKEQETSFGGEYERFRRVPGGGGPEREGDIRRRYLQAVEQLDGLFDCGEDKYWSYRYNLGGKKLCRPVSLLGKARLQEIVVNVVIPVLLLHFGEEAEEYESTLYLLYNFMPPPGENKITRFMRHRLFGKRRSDLRLESAVLQQGLHQLFKDYCSKDRGGCLGCDFEANLGSWLDRNREERT